ncbi:MAG TPA: bifunctional [glutamate--ammonia ligase]-adenylyl-L-tyrosine phosphorylase/[glutamate--ammonia-ligase] adenylyltransferase [Anaeromyxobacteraceae bacterium]|nr:bifunctional [glutamate--ammonia ligase]-adenylyl-L-tyrosine phosphorylase/[glutamate--ammonia-ligase] adenylyltransferase [Anaeromyxobacteraceae bacterium]
MSDVRDRPPRAGRGRKAPGRTGSEPGPAELPAGEAAGTGGGPAPPRAQPPRTAPEAPASNPLLPGVEEAPFRSADAPERLARLGRRVGERLPQLAALCRMAPDPDLALAGVERYLDAAELPAERDLLEALVLLSGGSRLALKALAREPTLLRRVARSRWARRMRPEKDSLRALTRAVRRLGEDDVAGLHRLLRRFGARELVRVALRDLRRARVSEVTRELSSLATACLDVAIRFHERRLRARHGAPAGCAGREPGAGFCALAMGKLGARELNFSSDIDLIYVYRSDGTTEGERPLPHFGYYAKLAELVTESLSKATEDGFVFRVDLNLRPDGHSGPIVNSIRAAELYYQSFGRSWERNALVKARPAAGDLGVGEELLAQLEPFIWRRSLDLDVIQEIQAMKARIDARAGAEGKDDLKLGRGGIREAEFFVTALQVLYGGKLKDPGIRERAVLPALDRLLFAGIVAARDRDALADAYLFLRRAEHRVQMVDGRQTHRLPPGPERLGLSRAMGFSRTAQFEEALAAYRERVASLFGGLLGTRAGAAPLDPELSLLADQQVEPQRRREIAGRRGFADPDQVVASLEALARRPTPFSRTGDPAAAVALLAEVLATPDPDQALSHLAEFAAALTSPEAYFKMLREVPRVARLLISLFGTSDFLSKRFLRHPELLDQLLREQVALLKDGADFRREIATRLALVGDEPAIDERMERSLAELRRYRNEEMLRVAMADIAGTISLESVSAQLSDLAESLLAACLELAEEEARAKGKAPPGGLCVIAMGKLGGREIGYHSDLDLIFLYPSEEAPGAPGEAQTQTHALFARLAQRLLSFLQMPLREGLLYKTDTRLRPSGNQGALVTSVQGFARYHLGGADSPQVRSATWERQALLRARYVAGDERIWERVRREILEPVLNQPALDTRALAGEIRRMRERMEVEIGQEAAKGKNPKVGRGGMVDIEFAVQFLQLVHGHDRPFLLTPSTTEALSRLRDGGLLRGTTYQDLAAGYEFHRRLAMRMRIVHDYSIDYLPRGGRLLAQLARRLGYYGDDPGARLLADYQRVTDAVRRAYDEIVTP